jgi:hypothetical protein
LALELGHALSGQDPWGYHLVNLAIHILAALALFGLARRTLLSQTLRERFGGQATWLACAAALLWLVHPLQTATVTYISEGLEALLGLFLLLAAYCAMRSWDAVRPGWWWTGAILANALGMASKEVMAVAPLLILLHDRAFDAGSFRESLRRRLPLYAGLAAGWLVLGALLLLGGQLNISRTTATWSAQDYALTQYEVVLHYLRLAFWPAELCLDYYWQPQRELMRLLPGLVIVGGLQVATIWALFRRPAWGFLGAWFFFILAPSSSFVPLLPDLAFEHRMYLPLAAVVTVVSLAGSAGVGWLARRAASETPPGNPEAATEHAASPFVGRAGRLAGWAVVLAAAALLSRRTVVRNADFHSNQVLWSRVALQRPYNPRAFGWLARLCEKRGDPAGALRYYDCAIAVAPTYRELWTEVQGPP